MGMRKSLWRGMRIGKMMRLRMRWKSEGWRMGTR
jgi:hypothetical protein